MDGNGEKVGAKPKEVKARQEQMDAWLEGRKASLGRREAGILTSHEQMEVEIGPDLEKTETPHSQRLFGAVWKVTMHKSHTSTHVPTVPQACSSDGQES
jgi:hypothetical protein